MIEGLVSEMKLLEVARIQREKIFQKEQAMKFQILNKVSQQMNDDSNFYVHSQEADRKLARINREQRDKRKQLANLEVDQG